MNAHLFSTTAQHFESNFEQLLFQNRHEDLRPENSIDQILSTISPKSRSPFERSAKLSEILPLVDLCFLELVQWRRSFGVIHSRLVIYKGKTKKKVDEFLLNLKKVMTN